MFQLGAFFMFVPLKRIVNTLKAPALPKPPLPVVYKWLMGIVVILLLVQAFFEAQHNGDFIGYVAAGQSVLSGKNIYLDYLNTWPPFFSIVAVPLALVTSVAPYLLRLFWLLGSLAAFYVCMRLSVRLFLKRKLLLPFQKAHAANQLVFHIERLQTREEDQPDIPYPG